MDPVTEAASGAGMDSAAKAGSDAGVGSAAKGGSDAGIVSAAEAASRAAASSAACNARLFFLFLRDLFDIKPPIVFLSIIHPKQMYFNRQGFGNSEKTP
ncbi:MAG: hypothetical protein K6F35_01665 [Lachnospiraceae bacterium]|nr:hypothetical protein [Lachnospiraceae bacterium]